MEGFWRCKSGFERTDGIQMTANSPGIQQSVEIGLVVARYLRRR